MRPILSIKGVRFDHNSCLCYHQIAMFAIFVPNFLSSSNLRLRKCHSFLTPFRALASKLGRNRALFASEEQNRLEKFRPYGLPDEKWLGEIGERLRQRTPPVGEMG